MTEESFDFEEIATHLQRQVNALASELTYTRTLLDGVARVDCLQCFEESLRVINEHGPFHVDEPEETD
jgi:hypothetical protein